MNKKGTFFYNKAGKKSGQWLRAVLPVVFVFGILVGDSYAFQNTDLLSQNHRLDIDDKGQFIDVRKYDVGDYFVSMNVEEMELKSALEALTGQVRVGLSYDSDADFDHIISLRAEDTAFYDVLDRMLEGSGLEYLVSANRNTLVIRPQKKQYPEIQETVTGTVTDAQTGEALPGVNIVVDGTFTGTTTNMDGEFELGVPNLQETLVFSYIGYQRLEVAINNRYEINVSLSFDATAMDEIVVVGFGSRLREELIGSVSTVSSSDLNTTSIAGNALSRLQGHVSGVTVTSSNTPGGSHTLRVRGMGTINDNSPLYVIDGVPTSGGLGLDPNDIESISVLKDASSAAIYGARGANGVVLITTKGGRMGQAPTLTFSSRTGTNQVINQHDVLTPRERGELLWLEAANMGVTPGDALYGDGETPQLSDYLWPAGAMEGDPSVDQSLYSYPGNLITRTNLEGTNWMDEIARLGVQQEYHFGVNGGSDNIAYSILTGYLNEQGYLKYTGFDRFSFRGNIDAQATNWLNLGQRLHVSRSERSGNMSDNSESGPIGQTVKMSNLVPVYDIAGNYAGTRGPNLGNGENPVAILDRDQHNYDRTYRIVGSTFGEVNLQDYLRFRSLVGFTYQARERYDRTVPNLESTEGRDEQIVRSRQNNSLLWNWQNTIEYVNRFADAHSITALVGSEVVASESNNIDASRDGYFNLDPSYMVLSAGEGSQISSGGISDWALISVFGRVNYDLLDKYLFEATIRRDGSSRFGIENRYATFPAFSAGWIVSSEDFMDRTSSWLDFLKLRIGWGKSGNDRIGNYNSFSTYYSHTVYSSYDLTGSNTSTMTGFVPQNIGNREAKWETVETLNVGIDANVFENISFSLDVWERNTSDMLYRLGIPLVAGTASAPFVNIGDMKNTGIDFEVSFNNTALGGDLSYGITANISHYKNEIIRLSDQVDEAIISGTFRGYDYLRSTNGSSFPQFWGYRVDGIFQSDEEAAAHATTFGSAGTYNRAGRLRFVDLNGDGIVDDNDKTWIGNPHPDFTGGLLLEMGYKNFDLNTFIYGSYGNDVINMSRRFTDYTLFVGNRSKDRLYKSWGSPYLDDNRDATLPIADRHSAYAEPSTHWIEDGSYLRMKSLQIGYNLPGTMWRNLRVYAQMTNVFTITNYSGLDPEINTGDSSLGIDLGIMPTPRQYVFGLTIEI
jgi:TonB-dependent starch-binding outer membrane protein SusC